MKKYQQVLASLLVVQLLLAVIIYWNGSQLNAGVQSQPLVAGLADNKAELDRVVISDGKATLELLKKAGNWQMPKQHSLPVSKAKLEGLLDNLANLKTSWPIAKTASSYDRFEVAKDKFQRHLQLYHGDKLLGDVYVGNSPSFRLAHVRRAGDDAVYSVKLSSYDLTVSSDTWLDHDLLSLKDLQQIQGPDYTLKKSADKWTLQEEAAKSDAAQAALDDGQVKSLVSAFNSLKVQAVDNQAVTDGVTRIKVSSGDKQWTYRFYEVDGDYLVKRDDRDLAFTMSKAEFEKISGIRAKQLAAKVPDDSKQSNHTQVKSHS